MTARIAGVCTMSMFVLSWGTISADPSVDALQCNPGVEAIECENVNIDSLVQTNGVTGKAMLDVADVEEVFERKTATTLAPTTTAAPTIAAPEPESEPEAEPSAQASPTCGGNAAGAPCAFPFTYKGTEFSECTDAGHTEPWCFVADGAHWGHCNCAQTHSSPAVKVNWDGFDSFRVEREEFKGFPAEIYYKIERNQLGAMNSSHVFVPFDSMMKAIFVRDMHDIGSYEYGMATWVWTRNLISVVSDNTVVGVAEKLHTFAHEGAWSAESLEKVRAVQDSRWTSTNMLAKAAREARSAAVNMWVIFNRIGGQLVNASMDPAVMDAVNSFASDSNSGSSNHFHERMVALGQNLTSKHDAYLQSLNGAFPSSSSTAVNCHHLPNWPGLEVAQDGFWLPLDQKIPSVRGQVVLAPIQRFDMMGGTSYLKYHADDQTFRLYMGAALHSNIVDPYVSSGSLRHQPKLFVGPADGDHHQIPADGRHPLIEHSAAGIAVVHGLHHTFDTVIPADYTFLFESTAELCTPDERANKKIELGKLDMMAITMGTATSAEKLHAVHVMTTAIGCAAEYLRSDIDKSHAYGPFEAFVFLHGVSEFGFSTMEQGWNTISTDIFCPDSGCISTTSTTTEAESGWW